MRVSAKVDDALRACLELDASPSGPVKGERIATAQSDPAEAPRAAMRGVLEETSLADLVAGAGSPSPGTPAQC